MSVWTGKTWHRRNLCAGEKPRHIINNKRPCGSTVFWLSLKSEYAADSPDQYCFMSTESIRLSHSSTLSSVAECNFRENESRETRHYERTTLPKSSRHLYELLRERTGQSGTMAARKAKRVETFKNKLEKLLHEKNALNDVLGKAGDKELALNVCTSRLVIAFVLFRVWREKLFVSFVSNGIRRFQTSTGCVS